MPTAASGETKLCPVCGNDATAVMFTPAYWIHTPRGTYGPDKLVNMPTSRPGDVVTRESALDEWILEPCGCRFIRGQYSEEEFDEIVRKWVG